MKFLELQLLAYGPFTDSVLDFSGADLQFVYGANEAGKSSALRAIHGLLFGIPTKCDDDQIHEKKQLRIGAVIQNSAKKKLRFHRRKGRKGTLLNPANRQGAAYADSILDSYLHGVDADSFGRVYGISHDELQRGGREMQSLRGLVGESLFAATLGGAGLAKLLNNMDAEAKEIYSAQKRNVRIKLAKRDYDLLKKERRELQLSKSRWEKTQADLARAHQRRAEVVQQEEERAQELHKLRRFQNTLSLITKRNELRRQRAALGDSVILPEHYSDERRIANQSELRHLDAKIERLQTLLDGEDGLQQQLAEIQIPAGLLDYADAIGDLKDQRAVVVKALQDRESLQRDCHQLQLQVESLLRDLGLRTSFEEADRFRLGPDQKSHIRSLAQDEKRLRERPNQIQDELADLDARLQQLQADRKQLGDPMDVTELRQVIDHVRRQGDLSAERDTLQGAVALQEEQLQCDLAALGLWRGTLVELSRLPIPMLETVDRFAREFADAHQRLERLQQDGQRLQGELAKERQAIAALQQTGHVPTEAELEQVRQQRNAQWTDLRSQLADGDAAFDRRPDSATKFEELLWQADSIADRLRREAERVSQLADRTARIARLREQHEEINQQINVANEAVQTLEFNWQREWKPCGVTEPLPPREMQSWLVRVKELRQVCRSLVVQQNELTRLEQSYQDGRQQLTELLERLGKTGIENATLDQLLDQAEMLVARQQALGQQRTALDQDILRCQAEQKELADEATRAQTALNAWQAQWSRSMGLLGCDEQATADQANERLDHLARMFQFMHDIEAKCIRIRDIEQDAQQFEESTARFAKKFLGDAELPASEAVLVLLSRLEQARDDQQRFERLNAEIDATQRELMQSIDQHRSLTEELDAICDAAGVEDMETLPQVVQASRQLADCQQRMEEIDEQLHELSGGTEIEQFIASASEWNADELHVRILGLERELEELKQQRDEAVIAVRDLETEVQQADGSGAAADKDQQALGLICRMQQDARRYMRLRMAGTMLRLQIEKYRAENADPLLGRASTLFSRITCREFSGIRTDYENDEPVIVGVRQSHDGLVPVRAMSDGTRDQLYLALRLAYVERQLIDHEPMPFIVDDILIHYDDRRARATLGVLAELATQTQVIFFTHHWHLIELAKKCLASNGYRIHQLDGDREAATAMASSRPR